MSLPGVFLLQLDGARQVAAHVMAKLARQFVAVKEGCEMLLWHSAKALVAAALWAGVACAQTTALPPGRALTTGDVAAIGITESLHAIPAQPDGTRVRVVHVGFQPMSFIPVVSLSVTQLDATASNGHLSYSVADGDPTCLQPNAADKQCNGVDVTITAGPGTDIATIHINMLVLNGLSPTLLQHATVKRPDTPAK